MRGDERYDLAQKQNIYKIDFGVLCCFDVLKVLKVLKVHFHSNSFIRWYPSITLRRNNAFHSPYKNYLPCSAIIFVSVVESRETSESQPSPFRVITGKEWTIPRKETQF